MSNKPCVVCGKILKPIEQYDEVGQEKCWTCWCDLREEQKQTPSLFDVELEEALREAMNKQ